VLGERGLDAGGIHRCRRGDTDNQDIALHDICAFLRARLPH